MQETFREWLDRKRELNEMPKYIDHDYLDFEPIDDKTMQFLEKQWKLIKPHFPSSKIKNILNDVKIFATNMNTMAIIGLTVYDEELKSWNLEIASYVKLERMDYGRFKVRAVYTKEEFRGSKYTLTLYYSLIKNGILSCSDNEQYQGAKPLWKALSRIVPVEVYNESTEETFDYDETKISDVKVWSTGYGKFYDILRVKS
jgi:hypothetical protein